MRSFLTSRKPFFSPKQIDRLSSIFENIGHVVFGVAVVGQLVTAIDNFNVWALSLGAIGSITSWSLSVWLARLSE